MECLKPIYLSKIDMVVPCGHCEFCGATKRSDWALRLHWEAKLHQDKKFVTLTYDDAHLVCKDGYGQLVKKHLQDFFREVRRTHKMRYFAVGEYGSKTYRPHYHVILFGSVPNDVLQREWKHGSIHVGEVNDASIMYCLGYLVNKQGYIHHLRNREKTFTLMSRRPGLGANYLSPEMIAWHKSGRKNYVQFYNEKRHLPRYYKCKIFSKIDLVRIAVRDQKDLFKKMVVWVRSKKMRRHRDPLAYRDEQLRIYAQRLRCKTKETQLF